MSDPRMDINSPYFNCVTREEYEAMKTKYELMKEACEQSIKNVEGMQGLLRETNKIHGLELDWEKQRAFNRGYKEGRNKFICVIAAVISIGTVIIVLLH